MMVLGRLALAGVLAAASVLGGPERSPDPGGEAEDSCYICKSMSNSSCSDWTQYDEWCAGIGCGAAASCTSNGCPEGLYRIDCGLAQ